MADDLIPNQIITLVSIIVGLLFIYGSGFSVVGGIFAILSSFLATIFGTNTLRHVGKYSLGTDVPSIVYMLTAVALVSYISGMIVAFYLKLPILFPITSIIIAAILALIISLICKHIFDIQVELLSKSFISIAVASSLLMISLSTLIAQTWNPTVIYETVIQNGIIILLMIMSVMAIQNPYNSCMGPNEDQIRTLALSGSNAFIMLMITSIISLLNTKYWILYLVLSVAGWLFCFRQYVKYTKQQAASVRRYGLWPTDDGDE